MSEWLIKAGRVFDGVADVAAEQAYVVVADGAVAATGLQSELAGDTSRFAEVLDLGADATLLPGLINMHAHMSFSAGRNVMGDHQAESVQTKLIRSVENLKAALAVGVTTLRDCGTLNEIAFAVRAAVEDGTLVGPRVVAAGEGITTTGGHCWFCGVEADSEDDVRRAVRRQVKAGADFIKLFSTGGNTTPGTNALAAQYTEAQMKAATEEATRMGLRTASHAHGTPGVHTSIAARCTTIEHCSFQTASGVVYEPEQVAIIAGEGLYVCPTIFQGLSKFKSLEDPDLAPGERAFLTMQRSRFEIVSRMVEQGVKIVSGSDAGVAHNAFGDYPGDLVLTVRGTGLSPAYVLRSATSVAAEALGRPELGSIAPGKAADLLAVAGNPLEDIAALLQPRAVFARGRRVA